MITGIDHVALPMSQVAEMLAFYSGIGAKVVEEVPGFLHAAYLGNQKINLHLPAAWQSEAFLLRGPGAVPGCGDLCFTWRGDASSLTYLLASQNVNVIEGPVRRQGGQGEMGTSFYVRDPDQNLIEFIIYDSHDGRSS